MSDPTRIDKIHPQPFPEVAPPCRTESRPKPAGQNGAASGPSFAELLRTRQGLAPTASTADPSASIEGGVRFSAHAQTRLQSRQIALGEGQLNRLQGAVQRAAGKGARDALVLMDDLAMVVSVTNRTVVTVVD